MVKKDKNKRVCVIVLFFLVVALFVFMGNIPRQASCIARGGEWKSNDVTGCCQDDEYWEAQVVSCERSGGFWAMPEFMGATIKDGLCGCLKGYELVCPTPISAPSPCAMCICQPQY